MTASQRARLKKVTWVVMGPDPWLATCERCKRTVAKPEMPCSLDALLSYLDYVGLLHLDCAVTA